MLILCNIFVELEHFIFFKNFDKYHNFIYYRMNIKLMVHGQFMSRCSHAASTPLSLKVVDPICSLKMWDWIKVECPTFAPATIAPVINVSVKRNPNPNPNPNPKPNLNSCPTPNQKLNHYPHSNSLLSEISSPEQLFGSHKKNGM